jgi:phosphatidylglycerol:prolipoprotein diacylglycerol transferase
MFHMYGLFIGIAVVAGYSVAEKMEPKVSKVAPWVLGFGFVGARLWHVIDMWSYYSLNLPQIVAVWNGGLGIWGGIIGGFAAYQFTIYNLQFTKNEQWSTLGAMVTGLPLAQAIGRLGNAVNGEFYDKVWILPWWGAEVFLDLLLFMMIYRLRGSSLKVGVYLVGYFLIRLILNPLRADLR